MYTIFQLSKTTSAKTVPIWLHHTVYILRGTTQKEVDPCPETGLGGGGSKVPQYDFSRPFFSAKKEKVLLPEPQMKNKTYVMAFNGQKM